MGHASVSLKFLGQYPGLPRSWQYSHQWDLLRLKLAGHLPLNYDALRQNRRRVLMAIFCRSLPPLPLANDPEKYDQTLFAAH